MSAEPTLKLFHCLPVPTGNLNDVYEMQPVRMAILHNIILRGFNSMIYYSGEVTAGTKKYTSFLNYCNEVINFVHHHHSIEETLFFPWLETKLGEGAMGGNLEGHEKFRAPLASSEELLANLRSGKATWDLGTFRNSLYELVEVLRPHLEEEIETLRPEKLKDHIPVDEFRTKEKEAEKVIMKQTSLITDIPIFFINGDGVNGAWFPPLPPPIAFLAKYPLWLIHSDWWAFGSCDKHRRVKPQFAAYEPSLENKEGTLG
ncbi:hypothetical protein FS837_011575 [Tulasnella sp. UAMH 9824]|nr:hypothetical protein FS837_011575 [Tulasnella sp. UAMH 9824]